MGFENPFTEPGDGALVRIIKFILAFASSALHLQSRLETSERDLKRLTRAQLAKFSWSINVKHAERLAQKIETRPTVMIANHPHGISDAYLLAHLYAEFTNRQPCILANKVAMRVASGLAPWMVAVDNQGRKSQARRQFNQNALQTLAERLSQGTDVICCPAGEVSHWTQFPTSRQVRDSSWHLSAFRLALQTRAQIIPVYLSGHNSKLFLVTRLFSRFLSRLLLFREFLNDEGDRYTIVVGSPFVPAPETSPEALMTETRKRLYALEEEERE